MNAQYWLLKTEPSCWSWAQQEKTPRAIWDDVHGGQAQNFMKRMVVGDLAFFYHTGKEKQIVGVVRVVMPFFPNPQDEPYGAIEVSPVASFAHPVTLKTIKEFPPLHHLLLVKQSRLSVMPIDKDSWHLICQWGSPQMEELKS